jgi:hypothetical protein
MTTTWIVITHFFRRKFRSVHRGAHPVSERMPDPLGRDIGLGASGEAKVDARDWVQDVGRDRLRN